MTKEQRIEAFDLLGGFLREGNCPEIQEIVEKAGLGNPWFTAENVRMALQAWAVMLDRDLLEQWLAHYPFGDDADKAVGLVFAGNVPLVGFHDLLAVLCAGFRAQVKFSSDDRVLMRFMIDQLIRIEPAFGDRITQVERLQGFDAVIATGSDNTARYFDYYFGKYPHIIRKNRNGAAVLDGTESPEQLYALGQDIFAYFGLGCRNVAKIFIPEGYDIVAFFEGIAGHGSVIDHYKYSNNYDFNKSIYLINGDQHYDNGFLLLKPDMGFASPLAVLYYEFYPSLPELAARLRENRQAIQCLVSSKEIEGSGMPFTAFGQAQYPSLTDYADGVDTLAFLADLSV